MGKKCEITREEILENLRYDPDDGTFTWIKRSGGRRVDGNAGSVNKDGYLQMTVNGNVFLAHRLAWFLIHNKWPEKEIDHANMDKLDNRISNLREATGSQNRANRKVNPLSKTGLKGVTFKKSHKAWCARITIDGKRKLCGYFKTPEEAHAAYCQAAEQHFGEFANFG